MTCAPDTYPIGAIVTAHPYYHGEEFPAAEALVISEHSPYSLDCQLVWYFSKGVPTAGLFRDQPVDPEIGFTVQPLWDVCRPRATGRTAADLGAQALWELEAMVQLCSAIPEEFAHFLAYTREARFGAA